MTEARYGFTATLLPDGRVLVAGGGTESGYLSQAEIYDPATGVWTPTGSMTGPRAWASATLLPDGLVLIAGGWDGLNTLNTAELYDPATGTWSPTESMHESRSFFNLTLLPDGQVLADSGPTAELYIPPSSRLSKPASIEATSATEGFK